jgi:hypothetical protein
MVAGNLVRTDEPTPTHHLNQFAVLAGARMLRLALATSLRQSLHVLLII